MVSVSVYFFIAMKNLKLFAEKWKVCNHDLIFNESQFSSYFTECKIGVQTLTRLLVCGTG